MLVGFRIRIQRLGGLRALKGGGSGDFRAPVLSGSFPFRQAGVAEKGSSPN